MTYHDEKVLEESGESILKEEEPQLRIFTMPYEFTLGLKTLLSNRNQGRLMIK